MGRPPEPIWDRFWAKVVVTDDCWEWQAYVNSKGYGLIGHENKMQLAHRVAYEMFVGSIPQGLQLDHLCRIRLCVNPRHVEPVTAQENSRRGLTGANNLRKTRCPKGHPLDAAERRAGAHVQGVYQCGAAGTPPPCRSFKEG